jgi:DNA-binding MarR family transcriptional regulator
MLIVSYTHDMSNRTPALNLALELTVLLSEDMRRGLAELGLTESRVRVVWVLHERGPSTQRALAEALEVAPRTVTTLVDSLVETGFVTREPHPTDRRATQVTLTDHGAEVAAELERSQGELAGQLFGDLDDSTYDGLVSGLTATVDRLRVLIAQHEDQHEDQHE